MRHEIRNHKFRDLARLLQFQHSHLDRPAIALPEHFCSHDLLDRESMGTLLVQNQWGVVTEQILEVAIDVTVRERNSVVDPCGGRPSHGSRRVSGGVDPVLRVPAETTRTRSDVVLRTAETIAQTIPMRTNPTMMATMMVTVGLNPAPYVCGTTRILPGPILAGSRSP